MKIVAYKERGKWWAKIDDNGSIILTTIRPENRVGCAIRLAMTEFQMIYGEPSESTFEVNLDDW